MRRHLLVIGDCLTYWGPLGPCSFDEPRLWPNLVAKEFEADLEVLVGPEWTARDASAALLQGSIEVDVDAVIVAVGGMDQRASSLPPELSRNSLIAGLRLIYPECFSRGADTLIEFVSSIAIQLTGGRFRRRPQDETDRELALIVSTMRQRQADIPLVLLAPGVSNSSRHHHKDAVIAARRWSDRHHTGLVEVDNLIEPSLVDGTANPDGVHYSWLTHQLVARAVANELEAVGFPRKPARKTVRKTSR